MFADWRVVASSHQHSRPRLLGQPIWAHNSLLSLCLVRLSSTGTDHGRADHGPVGTMALRSSQELAAEAEESFEVASGQVFLFRSKEAS